MTAPLSTMSSSSISDSTCCRDSPRGVSMPPSARSGPTSRSWPNRRAIQRRSCKVDDWGVPPYYELVITASEATIDDRPDVVERFLRATRRGYEDAIADPAAAIATLQAASPDLDVPVEEAGIALLIPVWTAGDVPFGTQTAARWDAYAKWMVERGLIPADLDVAAAWRGDLLPPSGTPVP